MMVSSRPARRSVLNLNAGQSSEISSYHRSRRLGSGDSDRWPICCQDSKRSSDKFVAENSTQDKERWNALLVLSASNRLIVIL